MAFIEIWDESKPDGAIQKGFELDDEVRTVKRALRERNEALDVCGWVSVLFAEFVQRASAAQQRAAFLDREHFADESPGESSAVPAGDRGSGRGVNAVEERDSLPD